MLMSTSLSQSFFSMYTARGGRKNATMNLMMSPLVNAIFFAGFSTLKRKTWLVYWKTAVQRKEVNYNGWFKKWCKARVINHLWSYESEKAGRKVRTHRRNGFTVCVRMNTPIQIRPIVWNLFYNHTPVTSRGPQKNYAHHKVVESFYWDRNVRISYRTLFPCCTCSVAARIFGRFFYEMRSMLSRHWCKKFHILKCGF